MHLHGPHFRRPLYCPTLLLHAASAAMSGGCVTFAGAVVSNTLADGYSVHAFLRLLEPNHPNLINKNNKNGEPDPFADDLIYAGQQVDITDGWGLPSGAV